jgi:hypothetical protein
MAHNVFIISPAHADGRRGQLLRRGRSNASVAHALASPAGAPLGDVFTFMSGLYFRGKRKYAETFADPPASTPGVLVIVPGHGLLDVNTPVSLADIQGIAVIPIDVREPRYREPLERDVAALAGKLTDDDRVIFLGSVATDKYLAILARGLGERLVVPAEFVGRGSMSRGSVALKSVEAGRELSYVPAQEVGVIAEARSAARS